MASNLAITKSVVKTGSPTRPRAVQPPARPACCSVHGDDDDDQVSFDTELGRCARALERDRDHARAAPRSPTACRGPRSRTASTVPRFVRRAIEGMRAVHGRPGGRPARRAARRRRHRRLPARRVRGDPRDRRRARPGATARSPARSAGPRAPATSASRSPEPLPDHRPVPPRGRGERRAPGFSAPGGLDTKRRMLELEGAPGYGQQVLFG